MQNCLNTRLVRENMINNDKYLKSDLTIISEPSYVKIYCPHCESEIEVEYGEFSRSMSSNYWCSWEGKLVYCEECENYFQINNVYYV